MAQPERTFSLFPELPKEIRLIIWEHALQRPRVVPLTQKRLKKTIGEWEVETGQAWPPPREDLQEEIKRRSISISTWQMKERDALCEALDAYEHGDVYKAGHLVGLASDCQMPEVMVTCREAYEVGSKSYERVFLCLGSIPTTWFSFELDILYLPSHFPAYFTDGGLGMITEELTISAFTPSDIDNFRRVKNLAIRGHLPEESETADLLRFLGGLEKLYLVYADYPGEKEDPRILSLMPPIDFHQTMAALHSDRPLSSDSSDPYVYLIPRREFKLEAVKDILNEDISLGKAPWKIPEIEKSVILPEDMVKELESAKLNFLTRSVDLGTETQGLG